MKPRSAIQKGKRLEQKIASDMRKKLGSDKAVRMAGSGSGAIKGDVFNRYFTIEAKNQEKVKIWEWWQQTVSQVQFNKPPVLVFSGNHRPILVTMSLNDWLDLVKEAKLE